MQNVSDDLLVGVGRLFPGQLQAAGAEGRGLEAGGGLGQLGSLADGEAGAGLVGAGTVLSDALIYGLVLGGDPGDGQSPAADRVRLLHSSIILRQHYFTCISICCILIFPLHHMYLITLVTDYMHQSHSSTFNSLIFSLIRSKSVLRVPVGQLDVAARRQQFSVLQPDEMRLRGAGRRAAEDGAAPCWSGDRLRPLDELWRS